MSQEGEHVVGKHVGIGVGAGGKQRSVGHPDGMGSHWWRLLVLQALDDPRLDQIRIVLEKQHDESRPGGQSVAWVGIGLVVSGKVERRSGFGWLDTKGRRKGRMAGGSGNGHVSDKIQCAREEFDYIMTNCTCTVAYMN